MQRKIDFNSIRKILLIKLRGIGDVVLSTIVLKNLRNAFPNAKIDYLTEPPSEPVLKNLPLVHDVLVYDRHTMNPVRFLFAVRKCNYDLIIDLFGNPRTALITRVSGATYRVGFNLRGRKYAYNILVERDMNLHSAEHNLLPLEVIGVQIVSRQLEFAVPESDMTAAEQFLQQNIASGKLLIGLALGGGWHSKRCTTEKFAAIADAVIERFGAEVIIVWGPQDKTDAERIHSLMRHRSMLLPPTTVLEAAAFFKQCDAVIANDSGPMHIAVAVGTPTLAIFGPTNPYAQGPYGEQHEWVRNEKLDCLCCNLLNCPIQHRCMTELPVEQVVKAMERLMQKNRIEVLHANP